MSLELEGTIYKIGETESFPSGFTKRLLVIESDGEYPQKIPLEFAKDKTSVLDNYKVGDKVKVGINLRGNEYQEKFYLSAQGWKIEKVGSAPVTTTETKGKKVEDIFGDDDDLNF